MSRPFLAIIISACSIFLFVFQALAAPVGLGGLVCSDEFQGTTLDPTKWTIRFGPGRDDICTKQAVSVWGDVLTIKTFIAKGTHYSGWIDTSQAFLPIYGYFESRMQFNTSHCKWSASWMQTPLWANPIFGNPVASGTEIDISEHRRVNSSGGDYRSRIHMANHWAGCGPEHKSPSSTQNEAPAGVGNRSWYTCGLLREPDKYTFYFDGEEIWSHTAAVSQRSEYLILSSEAQANSWAGDIPFGGYGSLATTTNNRLRARVCRAGAALFDPLGRDRICVARKSVQTAWPTWIALTRIQAGI